METGQDEAEAVFGNSLWTNPDDNQGIRYLLGPVKKGVAWHPQAG